MNLHIVKEGRVKAFPSIGFALVEYLVWEMQDDGINVPAFVPMRPQFAIVTLNGGRHSLMPVSSWLQGTSHLESLAALEDNQDRDAVEAERALILESTANADHWLRQRKLHRASPIQVQMMDDQAREREAGTPSSARINVESHP